MTAEKTTEEQTFINFLYLLFIFLFYVKLSRYIDLFDKTKKFVTTWQKLNKLWSELENTDIYSKKLSNFLVYINNNILFRLPHMLYYSMFFHILFWSGNVTELVGLQCHFHGQVMAFFIQEINSTLDFDSEINFRDELAKNI